jgi:hypothetical protein
MLISRSPSPTVCCPSSFAPSPVCNSSIRHKNTGSPFLHPRPLIRRALRYTPAQAHSLCTHGWSADSEGESAEPPNMPLTFACTQAPCRRPPYLVCYFFLFFPLLINLLQAMATGCSPVCWQSRPPRQCCSTPPFTRLTLRAPQCIPRVRCTPPRWCAPLCAPSSLMPP